MKQLPWKHHFWLVGVLLSPLLFGAVTGEGQAVVALIFAAGLLTLATEYGCNFKPLLPRPVLWVAVALAILPIVPLPAPLVALVSPQTARLAQAFPVEPGSPPAWITLSLSPAGTMQRLWELAIIFTAFCLARHSATDTRFPRHLAWSVAAGLALVATSDVWLRASGDPTILGIWKPSWGKGAGTFANRNHFANWCVVGVLFCIGWVLRSMQPLHGAREGPSPSSQAHALQGQLVAVVVLFATVMAVLCASRGGLVALVAGSAAWLVLMWRRSRRRGRWFWIGGIAAGGLGLALAFGGTLLDRLLEAPDDLGGRYPKVDIWVDTLRIAAQFPAFGTGWGSFVTAFAHFKSFGGNATFWHAENECVQLALETGLAGVLVIGFILSRALWAPVRSALDRARKLPEPEVFFGALAALVAFGAHAVFEFVFQITSTAVLAAVMLGFLVGSLENAGRPELLPPPPRRRVALTILWGIALAIAAVMQIAAWAAWEKGRKELKYGNTTGARKAMGESVGFWPWNMERQMGRLRAEVAAIQGRSRHDQREAAAPLQESFHRALRHDPLNWELRLERAWFGIAFDTDAGRAENEAWEAVKLNPQQPLVPLRFARYFAARDPGLAWRFLEAARLSNASEIHEALGVAWEIRGDATALWSVAPVTRDGMLALGDFACDKSLYPLAAQAYSHAEGVAPLLLAKKLLRAKRPDLALKRIPSIPGNNAERLVAAEANLDTGNFEAAVRHAQSVWQNHTAGLLLTSPAPVIGTLSELRQLRRENPADSTVACQIGEAIFRLPPKQRDLNQLRQLADQFPSELRLQWLEFRTELDLERREEAARKAVALAEVVAAREE